MSKIDKKHLIKDVNVENEKGRIETTTDHKDNQVFTWESNPAFKDKNVGMSLFKAGYLMFLFLFIFFNLLYNLRDYSFAVVFSILVSLSLMGAYLILFNGNLFSLAFIGNKSQVSFNLFKYQVFWRKRSDPATLFHTNKHDSITTSIRIFRLRILPENVTANIFNSLKSFSIKGIPFTFQVIQCSLTSDKIPQSSSPSEIHVIYTIYHSEHGRITTNKIDRMQSILKKYTNAFQSEFASNFHHFKVVLLQGSDLIRILRKSITNLDIEDEDLTLENTNLKSDSMKAWIKATFIAVVIIIVDLMFFFLPISRYISIIAILLINLVVLSFIFFAWWREILFQISKHEILKQSEVELLNPFEDFTFFQVKKIPETLFVYVRNAKLIGIKSLNLHEAHPPGVSSPDKFYEALMADRMNYSLTVNCTPMTLHHFMKSGFRYLKKREQLRMELFFKQKEDKQNWLNERAGIWETVSLLSTSKAISTVKISVNDITNIEEALSQQVDKLEHAFTTKFMNCNLELLHKTKLFSAVLMEILKTRSYRINHSHLTYFLFQGSEVLQLISIANVLKKGIETRIAAEFNTPLKLENFISIGTTINTEILEGEVTAGFTREQLRSLLITNGTSQNRENLCIKLAMELIRARNPSIIIDFNGSFSKLIRIFNGTQFEDSIRYYKLGKSFMLHPELSGVPDDPDNLLYLELFYDAISLCFRKEVQAVEGFKSELAEKKTVESVQLGMVSEPDWVSNPLKREILSLCSELTGHDAMRFLTSRNDLNYYLELSPSELLENNKTIILDLSLQRDDQKKCFFAFIILAKIIHYLPFRSRTIPKFVFLPHVEIPFEHIFLDKLMRYGKIGKFLDPLIKSGFGLIVSSAQIHYLHPNFLTYVNNIVTFKAIDNRDLSILEKVMGLEQIHGKGYYSNRRNESFQIKYLMKMNNSNVLMKRDDIPQPFPVQLDITRIITTQPLSWEQVVEYMGKFGHDLEKTEKIILSVTKDTIFQKDLGSYFPLVNKICRFLMNLKAVDKVGNLFPNVIKEQLLKYLYEDLSIISQKRSKIKKMRDEIFRILVEHGYLIESHPRQAGGSQTVRTSYVVGDKLKIAMDDYYESRHEIPPDIDAEIITADSVNAVNFTKMFSTSGIDNVLNALKKELMEIMERDGLAMFKAINAKNYKECFELGKYSILRFLVNTYKRLNNKQNDLTKKGIMQFIEYLGDLSNFPYSSEELSEFIGRWKTLSIPSNDFESTCNELYRFHMEFLWKLKLFVYQEVK